MSDTVDDSKRLHSALAYAAAGLHVVLLGDAGTAKGKVPRLKSWGTKTTLNEEKLLDQFEGYPSANIGVLLGEKGGVIDVEFDCPEGRATADKLFTETITPTYESVRSIHRLFKWSGELPPIQKIELDGLEIRLGGGDKQTQSVLPPSVHPDGTPYRWLPGLSIHECELADLPDELACRICNVETMLEAGGLTDVGTGEKRPQSHWDAINGGVDSGGRNDALASLCGRQLQNYGDIEDDQVVADLFQLVEAWNDRNKPPMAQRELRNTFNSILNRERRRRLEESLVAYMPKNTQQQVASAAGLPAGRRDGLRLTIIKGEPAIYRLHWGAFSDVGGFVDLTSGQLGNFAAVRTAALESAFVWLPDEMRKKWSSRKGIVQDLVATAERVDPDQAVHRPSILAEAIINLTLRAIKVDEDLFKKEGVRSGTGVERLGDTAVINSTRLLSYLRAENVLDKLKQPELIRLLRSVHAKEQRSKVSRWWSLEKQAITSLKSLFLGEQRSIKENQGPL